MDNLSHLSPLIDADVVCYAAGFSADAQVKKEWAKEKDVDYKEHIEDCEEAVKGMDYLWLATYTVDQVMKGVVEKFTGPYRCYLTGKGNFRDDVATIKPYKGNRDASHKPKYYKEIKHHLRDNWNAETITGQEADDAMAQAQWAAKDQSTIIASVDKDLIFGVPGHSYNFRTGMHRYTNVRDANLFHFRQMLEGDSADNIPGIRGLGPKRTTALLESTEYDLSKFRDIVQAEYRKVYGEDWEVAYQEVSDLLWLRRIEGRPCPFLWN